MTDREGQPLYKRGTKLLGIDFGTTNSVVAIIADNKLVVIPSAEGTRMTPSVVAITKNGEHLVGEIAKRQAIMHGRGKF